MAQYTIIPWCATWRVGTRNRDDALWLHRDDQAQAVEYTRISITPPAARSQLAPAAVERITWQPPVVAVQFAKYATPDELEPEIVATQRVKKLLPVGNAAPVAAGDPSTIWYVPVVLLLNPICVADGDAVVATVLVEPSTLEAVTAPEELTWMRTTMIGAVTIAETAEVIADETDWAARERFQGRLVIVADILTE